MKYLSEMDMFSYYKMMFKKVRFRYRWDKKLYYSASPVVLFHGLAFFAIIYLSVKLFTRFYY